jgi:hypothetical protein
MIGFEKKAAEIFNAGELKVFENNILNFFL